MKVIVTGGAGFVGSNMIKKLNHHGITDIVIIDNYSEAKFNNLRDLSFSDFIDFNDSISAVQLQLEKLNKPVAFFHIGANADVLERNPKNMMHLNFEFSKMYYTYCSLQTIPFIYASTSAIYGNSKSSKIKIENEAPHNIYAWSKWLFDKYITARLPDENNKVIGLRLFNVFGLREFHKGKNACIANRFVSFIQEKGFIDLFEDKIERDYVWVEDLVEVFYQAFSSNQLSNGIYNVGGGSPISHKEIAEMVVQQSIDNGLLNTKLNDVIKLVSMPDELKHSFQFYTCAEDVHPLISSLTQNNKLKMQNYIKELIARA